MIQPAFYDNNIPVVLCSSSYYVPYLNVVIQSIAEHISEGNQYDILVLNSEILPQDKAKTIASFKKFTQMSIRFIDVDEKMASHKYNFREGYSRESFYRVIMIDILKNYDKIVYLDCDLVLMEDVAELYSTDVAHYLAAAVRDPAGIGWYHINHNRRLEYAKDVLRMAETNNYFQSGVMVFHLNKIRETYTIEEILEVACMKEIAWGDQDVLNRLFYGNVKFLEPHWNVIINNKNQTQIKNYTMLSPQFIFEGYMEARKCPKIIHYAGTKPWTEPNCDMGMYYWKYARNTSYYKLILERETIIPYKMLEESLKNE